MRSSVPYGMLLALVLLGSAGVRPALAQTSRPEITDIRFHGNRVFGDDRLANAIQNRETSCKQWVLSPFCWAGMDFALDRRYLEPAELPRDVLRLQAYYWLRGYREAQVDTTVNRRDGRVAVDFDITEGEPVLVESLDVLGAEGVDAPGLVTDLPLEVGDPLSAIRIEAVKDTLVSRLREVGYAYAAAYSGWNIPADTRAAQVSFNVDPGPASRFGPVTVDWLPGPDGTPSQELDETSVRRMVPFNEGEQYRYSRLVEGQRNLYSLELIRAARVQPGIDSLTLDSIIPVRIRVAEGDLRRVRAGAGWSTAECFTTEAEWASRNFQGGARRLTVGARVANILAPQLNDGICPQTGDDEFARLNGRVSVELFQPWLFSPRNSLRLSAVLERQSLPDIFVREALGFTVALSRTVGIQAQTTLSYQPALTRLDAGEVFFCVSFLLCTEQDIRVFESANWLSPVGLGFAVNRSNRLLNPTAGYSVNVDLEHASRFTASDFSYNRALAEATGYVGLGEETVLAARIRGGWVRPNVFELEGTERQVTHPQKRFYSGGAASVRGFAQNRLGPRVLSVTDVRTLLNYGPQGAGPVCQPADLAAGTCDASGLPSGRFAVRPTGGDAVVEANLELRFPFLFDSFQGATFVDVGQVWARTPDQVLTVDLGELEVSPGFGVRWFSPVGPVRVDVAYRFRDAQPLPVLTESLEPCVVADGCSQADQLRIRGPGADDLVIPWRRGNELQRLGDPVPFGEARRWWQRLQVHFSIGQAF